MIKKIEQVIPTCSFLQKITICSIIWTVHSFLKCDKRQIGLSTQYHRFALLLFKVIETALNKALARFQFIQYSTFLLTHL